MKILGLVGLLAIFGIIFAAVFFFGGFYDTAANAPDPKIIDWALERIRDSSIDRHARGEPPMPLDDPAAVQAGARSYSERGCVNCHGGPGADWAKFADGMNPGPPDLKDVVEDLEPRELFWVIRNGIKMTAMPSFEKAGVPDREIWDIVAFVRKLPSVSEQDFKTWSVPAPGGR
jgi:mono/diheme cytochrome c family protein